MQETSFCVSFVILASAFPWTGGGDRKRVKKSLDKLAYLLKRGESVTIFPEGARSRTGRVDVNNFSYGVGRLVKKVKDCKVLCVYLRGKHQKKFSRVPRMGEDFYCDMKLIKPETTYQGLRATKDIATQIIRQLSQMEQTYFAFSRQ